MAELIEHIDSTTPQFNSLNVQMLLEAIANGHGEDIITEITNGGGASLIKTFLDQAKLEPEQQALIHTLMSLSDEDDQNHETVTEGSSIPYGQFEENTTVDNDEEEFAIDNNDNISSLQQELEDLRVANDMFAAAVGACPYCWGGDDECIECAGEGIPGSLPPDLELFNEFVAPAVTRIRSMRRSEHLRFGHKRR